MAISGIRNEWMQKSGERSRGARSMNRTLALGVHDGGMAEVRTSAAVRSGLRAANAAAMRPP
jgi:hypothetical protein